MTQIDTVPRDFSARVDRNGERLTLNLEGEFDVVFRDAATALFAAAVIEAPTVLVINLDGLTFMDSTGIHCLLTTRTLAVECGVHLVIVRGSGPAHRTLALCGADQAFEMVDDPSQIRDYAQTNGSTVLRGEVFSLQVVMSLPA